MTDYQFKYFDKVRDYECDLQGIVNNSVYQNYLEHTRHEFLLDKGVDFAALAAQKINLVVTRAELDYKRSLLPGDEYWVGLNFRKASKIRFEFEQNIYRKSDDALCVAAKIIGVSLNEKGRPTAIGELAECLLKAQ